MNAKNISWNSHAMYYTIPGTIAEITVNFSKSPGVNVLHGFFHKSPDLFDQWAIHSNGYILCLRLVWSQFQPSYFWFLTRTMTAMRSFQCNFRITLTNSSSHTTTRLNWKKLGNRRGGQNLQNAFIISYLYSLGYSLITFDKSLVCADLDCTFNLQQGTMFFICHTCIFWTRKLHVSRNLLILTKILPICLEIIYRNGFIPMFVLYCRVIERFFFIFVITTSSTH